MTSPRTQRSERIPCLDGLRAISIAMVIAAHMEGTMTHDWTGPMALSDDLPMGDFVDLGSLGVRVFFVISGFLITKLLIEEQARTGTISLQKFYFRRAFRIFPAFAFVVGAIAIAGHFGWIKLRVGDVFHALTFTMNYHHDRAWELGHVWSIAVEEQFYLVWPALLIYLRPRGALIAAAATMLVTPIVKVATWKFFPDHRAGIGETFQTVADTLATGAVLALVRDRINAQSWFARAQSHGAAPIVLFATAVAMHHLHTHASFGFTLGETLTNISIALCIDACARNPGSLVGRFLEQKPLVFAGTLSYSIYLVQQPFLYRDNHAWWASFPANLGFVLGAALVSYYLVEKPFLGLRMKLERAAGRPREAAVHAPEGAS
ncbi:MAG: acyltransferase [Polyangiaceae bacterium]|nr:acyltransferase [Polyangiaceae bacterium]